MPDGRGSGDGGACPHADAGRHLLEDGGVERVGEGFSHTVAVIGSGIAEHFALPVDGAVGSLHNQFCLAISVEVVDDERHVMGAAADVLAQVDTPQAFST